MGNKLLVRSYNVELGDCIYVRIPNGSDDFHILIDCGTKGKKILLETAVKHLLDILPAGDLPGKKRLDLLVATHRHEDHIKGFDPEYFKDIQVKNIWLSALMDPNHPQAQKSLRLEQFTAGLVQEVVESETNLSPEMEILASLFNIDNVGAENFLREDLPRLNNIQTQYVVAGKTSTDYGVNLAEATIKILGPEKDIDGYYLGRDIDDTLNSIESFENDLANNNTGLANDIPQNISQQDFRMLKSRMLSDAFFFAEVSSKVTNNSSVVLLIEWKGNRLLFVGDTEWHGEYHKNKRNGGWNVMWNVRKKDLNRPVDFLKIGHHGSYNATPWDGDKGDNYEVNQILNAILPIPPNGEKSKAKAIVSTERSTYKTIPKADLLVELGHRVDNTRNYADAFAAKGINPEERVQKIAYERDFLDKNQPYRTDFEGILNGKDYVEVEFEAKN